MPRSTRAIPSRVDGGRFDRHAVRVERSESRTVVHAKEYTLELIPDAPRVRLSSLDGRPWSELSLIASAHRPDAADEGWAVGEPRIEATAEGVVLRLASSSRLWSRRELIVECRADELRVRLELEGDGRLGDLTLLGGRAMLASGAGGEFRSSIDAAALFVPAPTEPVQAIRSSASAARMGVVGDADPGRLHGIFSPPPLCLALGRGIPPSATALPAGEWLAMSLIAPIEQLGFTEFGYEPLDGGFLLRLAYDGRTRVTGRWTSPELVLRPVGSPLGALQAYRDELVAAGYSAPAPATAPWHLEPLFCGWGAQCARAVDLVAQGLASARVEPGMVLPPGAAAAPDLARQELYDEWLATLDAQGVRPGTIVIDDRWQAEYGTNRPDHDKWPDLAAWIRGRHDAGQRVLLWFKAWDPHGLDPTLCVRDPAGAPVAADPGHPGYLAALREQVRWMLSPDGLDADGFKVDFTQRAPMGALLSTSPESAADQGVWGIAALHRLLATIHEAAHDAKPDALVIAHAVHPSFAGVSDMIRLNDVLERDAAGTRVPVEDQLAFRHAITRAVLPDHPIDTDQWPMPDRASWLSYARRQPALGVPALYYVDAIDGSGERIPARDLREIAQLWAAYRAELTAEPAR